MPDITPVTPIATKRRADRLLSQAPIAAILDAMGADLERLRRLEPAGGAKAALDDYYGRLAAAIDEALTADVWLDAETVAVMRDISVQAVTKACRQGRATARKSGGVWEIHKDSALADWRQVG